MDRNYFGITDTGKIRDNNEDTFIAEKTADGNFIIACVIDGVGGYSGGEIASGIARQSIIRHLHDHTTDLLSLMKKAIIAADEQIVAEKQKAREYENMACVLTLAVIDLHKNQFFYAHVGDTRLYLLRDNSLVKISKDQSFVGFMEDTGRLTEEQAMRHPKRNEINKALGFGTKIAVEEDYVETGQSPFLPRDMLLLCSDGLSDMVNKQDIANILINAGSLQEKGPQLIAMANNNGGRDNITVVLVKNDNQSQVHELAKPVFNAKKISTTANPQVNKPVAALQEESITPQDNTRKSNTGLITTLSILCFIFLCASLYLLWQNYNNETSRIKQHRLSTIKPPRNPQEKKLQDTLNKLTGNALILTDSLFKSPIIITEPLQFNKDSLFIIARNNITLRSDTSFRGMAIVIRPVSKFVFLENITFENFNTVISSQNNALVLKNVTFINSPNAIQTIYNFPPARSINGKISRSTFRADSLLTPVNN